MLSSSSFNALLKSIEEPPPHVVFMMATTELQKIPDTVLSRSQVYEFRTISAKTVAERLRYHRQRGSRSAFPDEALQLLARAGEGSMRDSLSAFDQVRAFAGDTITRRRCGDGAGAGRPRPRARHARRGRRRGRAGGVRAGRARDRARLRPAAAVPRAGARDARSADPVGRSARAPPTRRRRRRRARPAQGDRPAHARAKICCAASTCSRRVGAGSQGRRPAALQRRDGVAAT